jgi:hypothetical protein
MQIPFCFGTYTSANRFKATRQLTSLLVQGVSPCTSLRVANIMIGKRSCHTGRHAPVAVNARPGVPARAMGLYQVFVRGLLATDKSFSQLDFLRL